MSGAEDWCTIESDPGVFTELLGTLGCDQVQLEELWTLDDEALAAHGEIFGLIFLFQWQQKDPASVKKPCLAEDQIPEGLFFAHQVTTNACATQAILSVVLNQETELGSTLNEFKEFTASFPPSLKGVAISSSDPIRKAHNAFGRQDAFLNDGKYISNLRGSDDVFHFVAYIPKGNTVYELDGLQEGPVVVGEYSDAQPWLSVARTAMQERMTGDAIKFNLMAVVKDKRIALKAALDQNPTDETAMLQLQMEEQKRAQWTLENQRRRHNYVPLCVAMLKELARAGKLPELVEKAKERKAQKRAKKN
jgi:ubiquitin carboxyl-terminal hydrolase L5